MTKADLRVQLKARRAQLSKLQRETWSASAQAHLLSSPLWHQAQTIALYHPFPTEVSTADLMHAAWAQGKRVGLPVTPPRGQPLRFLEVQPDTARVPGPMGTREPPNDCPELPLQGFDLVVLPGLGWDRSGTRLGYGGGYYDRSFSSTPAARVQLAFAAQEQPDLPRNSHDLVMHAIASERGLLLL